MAGDRRSIKYQIDSSDTKVFAVQTREGETVLGLLNAIVRGHGTLVWGFGPEPTLPSGVRVSLYNAFGGGACAILRAASPATVPKDLEAFSVSEPDNQNILDRIVGSRRDGSRLAVSTMSGEPATLAGVPVGFESDPARTVGFREIPVTGMFLRDALNAMQLLDLRYEWREMNGTIVIRTVRAWNDRKHPLNAKVKNLRLIGAPVGVAVSHAARLMGNRRSPAFFIDTRTVSVDLPDGTILDFITAIARAADLSWSYGPLDRDTRHRTGLDHLLGLQFRGRGLGIPVR